MEEHAQPRDLAHSTPEVSVSVVCANYNHAAFLPDLLDSIWHATVWPEQMIIVDDGSTDDSLDVLESYAHLPFLTVISFPENRGIAHALNEGVKHATGKYIMRIDADDYISHTRIERQYNYLEEHPEVDLVGSNVTYFEHGSGRLISQSNFPIGVNRIRRRYERGENGVLHSTIMARRSLMNKYSYQQHYVPSEDYDIFSRIVKDGHVLHNMKDALTFVRVIRSKRRERISYSSIQTNFKLRDKIFGKHTSRWQIFTYYWHLTYYQKYLFETSSFFRIIFIVISGIIRPDKIFRRLIK